MHSASHTPYKGLSGPGTTLPKHVSILTTGMLWAAHSHLFMSVNNKWVNKSMRTMTAMLTGQVAATPGCCALTLMASEASIQYDLWGIHTVWPLRHSTVYDLWGIPYSMTSEAFHTVWPLRHSIQYDLWGIPYSMTYEAIHTVWPMRHSIPMRQSIQYDLWGIPYSMTSEAFHTVRAMRHSILYDLWVIPISIQYDLWGIL